MNIIEALNNRLSTRAFKPDPVSKETLMKILEAANRTPSWGNTQPWEAYITGGKVLDRIRQGNVANAQKDAPRNPDLPAPQSWPEPIKKRYETNVASRLQALGIARDDKVGRQAQFQNNMNCFGAPVVIYLCLDKSLASWSLFDLGAYSMNIMLAAQEHGLGSIPAFNLVIYPDVIRKELEIPSNISIALGIALGYSDLQNLMNQFHSARRPVQEVIHFKGF